MAKAKLGSGTRFKNFTNKLKKEGYSEESADRISASAGRKTYGKKKMEEMATEGKEKKHKEMKHKIRRAERRQKRD